MTYIFAGSGFEEVLLVEHTSLTNATEPIIKSVMFSLKDRKYCMDLHFGLGPSLDNPKIEN